MRLGEAVAIWADEGVRVVLCQLLVLLVRQKYGEVFEGSYIVDARTACWGWLSVGASFEFHPSAYKERQIDFQASGEEFSPGEGGGQATHTNLFRFALVLRSYTPWPTSWSRRGGTGTHPPGPTTPEHAGRTS